MQSPPALAGGGGEPVQGGPGMQMSCSPPWTLRATLALFSDKRWTRWGSLAGPGPGAQGWGGGQEQAAAWAGSSLCEEGSGVLTTVLGEEKVLLVASHFVNSDEASDCPQAVPCRSALMGAFPPAHPPHSWKSLGGTTCLQALQSRGSQAWGGWGGG